MSLLKVNEVTDLGGGVPDGVGKILQVVSTTKTDTFTSSSTSFVDVTGLSVSITPTATSSKIFVVASVSAGATIDTQHGVRLMRDSTAIAIGDAAGSRTRTTTWQYLGASNNAFHHATMTSNFLDSPNTSSTLTYKLQVQTSGGTLAVNRNGNDTDIVANPRSVSSITVMEVAG